MKKRRARSLAQHGLDTDRAGEACASFSTVGVSCTGRVAETYSSFNAHGSGARGMSESRVHGFSVEHGA